MEFAEFATFATAADSLSLFCFQKFADGSKIAFREASAVKQKRAAGKVIVTYKVHREVIGEDCVLLCVSGRITGDDVNTFRALLEQEKSSALTLDLKDVRLVDGEAVKLLATHESKGTNISNCPLFIREWIRRERGAN